MSKTDIRVCFNDCNLGVCPICGETKTSVLFQEVQHCQSTAWIEVCTDCKNDFIRINDIFFRRVL